MQQDSTNKWSPFSPEWYKLAFDRYTSTSDQLLKQSEILAMGFSLPDADGSKSSVFRDDAVLNNSFNESALRDTLKDIYLSTSHKMMASNHDNVHFFKWSGSMSDKEVVLDKTTNTAEITVPTDTFIKYDLRDRYKLNKFYRRWIHATDILNNWDIFHWMCLIFIDGRVSSDYQLMMDDRQTIIKMPYDNKWVERNSKVMIVKFDTLYQKRISVTKEQITKTWGYKMPIDLYPELKSYNMVSVFISRYDDKHRTDNKERIVTTCGSVDFLPIKDGYIDLNKMSTLNKNIIDSEFIHQEYLTLMIPKYLQQYPILLPYDTVFRSYTPSLIPVFVSQYGANNYVGTEYNAELTKVYVDTDEDDGVYVNGWSSAVRPIVLSDSYVDDNTDIYSSTYDELAVVDRAVSEVLGAMDDIISSVPNITISAFTTKMKYLVDKLMVMDEVYRNFFLNNGILVDEDYVAQFDDFILRANNVIKNGPEDPSLYDQFMKDGSFWTHIVPLIEQPRILYEKIIIGRDLLNIDNSDVWGYDDQYKGQRRFLRPVDVSDFLIMEYDRELTCWTPVDAEVKYHFPDVYTIESVNGEPVVENRIFKAFFFYSDNPNPRKKSVDMISATPEWDVDTEVFELTTERQLQDIFIEKFYWAGIQMVYKGVLKTKFRWELIEYVNGNPAYDRFNDLFMNTMEEYFKLGMATFISGDNAYFPFDDAVAKFKENLSQKFLGYAQVNNFERYLKKTFIPSYFDYIERIDLDKEWEPVLVKRPGSTFNIDAILNIFEEMKENIVNTLPGTYSDMDYILDYMTEHGIESEEIRKLINELKDITTRIVSLDSEMNEFILALDMDTYSLDDLSKINDFITAHNSLVDQYIDYINRIEVAIGEISIKYPMMIEEDCLYITAPEKYFAFDSIVTDVRNTLDGDTINGCLVYNYNDENPNEYDEYMSGVSFTVEDGELILEDDNKNNPYEFTVEDDGELSVILDESSIIDQNEIVRTDTPEWGDLVLEELSTDNIDDFYNDVVGGATDGYHLFVDNGNLILEVAESDIDNVYTQRLHQIEVIGDTIDIDVRECFDIIRGLDAFDIDGFMQKAADPRYYGSITSSDDHSLIGIIDQFRISWNKDVLDLRDDAYLQYIKFMEVFKAGYVYTDEASKTNYLAIIDNMYNTTVELRDTTRNWCDQNNFDRDPELEEVFEYVISTLANYRSNLDEYFSAMERLDNGIANINRMIDDIYFSELIEYDIDFATEIRYYLRVLRDKFAIVTKMGDSITIGELDTIRDLISEWLEYTTNEKILFDELSAKLSPYGNDLITVFRNYQVPLSGIYNYITSVMEDYIPDKSPTVHSKIYKINAISVEYSGFNYAENDKLYIPGVGVYNIDMVSNDDKNGIRTLSLLDYQFNTFRDPCVQYGVYDTATNASGLGATLRAITSTSDIIVNDDIVKPYLNKINNVIILLERNYRTFNVDNNDTLIALKRDFNSIIEDWNTMIAKYNMNVSEPVEYKVKSIMEAISATSNIVTLIDRLVAHREEIDMTYLTDRVGRIRTEAYNYYRKKSMLDSRFDFFDGNLSSAVMELTGWYNYGYDGNYDEYRDTFIDNINNFLSHLSSYNTQIISFIETTSIRNTINGYMNNINTLIRRIRVLLSDGNESITNDYNNIDEEIANLKALVDMSTIPFQVDRWYEVSFLSISQNGSGYKVGDVVRTTKVEVSNGVYEDISNDKVIFGVVKRVDANGSVLTLDPLLQYAFQEDISGEYITEAEFGNGTGLHVKIYIEAVTASTITTDISSTVNRYNDNDLIMFNFTNSRDLDIKYDVFMRGIQQDYPIVRHNGYMPNGTGGHDTVYINANSLMDLAESSIIKKDENYFMYSIDKVTVTNPGTGYTPGEIIYADANGIGVKLQVADVTYPMGAIKSVNIIPDEMTFKGMNPECDDCPIIVNNFDNIDDEFNNSDISRNSSYMHLTISDDEGYGVGEDGVYPGAIYNTAHFDRVAPILPDITHEGNQNPSGYEGRKEYQFIDAVHFHRGSRSSGIPATDIRVASYEDLPKTSEEWNTAATAMHISNRAKVGAYVHIINDAMMHGHNTKYMVRGFSTTGYILYSGAEYDDTSWDKFSIVWNEYDSTPDLPATKDIYPDMPIMDASKYTDVEKMITSKRYDQKLSVNKYGRTYIRNMTTKSNLAVYNYTTRKWEDLSSSKWVLTRQTSGGVETGFTLRYNDSSNFSYEMWLYIIKDNRVQVNRLPLQTARVSIGTSIYREVNNQSEVIPINVSKDIRIRKIFPYDCKFDFNISNDNKIMDCNLNRYIHYKNELHLEDIVIVNQAGQFMDVMDDTQFEVQFKDPRAIGNGKGKEIQTYISYIIITDNAGVGFVDGRVWGYNEEYNTYIFGTVESDLGHPIGDEPPTGKIIKVNIDHFINPPKYSSLDNVMGDGDSTTITFNIYQGNMSSIADAASITVTFTTKQITEESGSDRIHRDGYIHNVKNPLAPLPKEFRIIYKGSLPSNMEMSVIIDKNYREWSFVKDTSVMFPVFRIDGEWLKSDRIYITTRNGRLPLVNPSTGRPSFIVSTDSTGTNIKILAPYAKYERITVHYVPYPMRSVYTRKAINENGFVDVYGKLNKPLNKKYFEFWMNGRLLTDEVSIISPTMLFLHGLKSLRNFEIVEINRDPNEYFSDIFIDNIKNDNNVIIPIWNFKTYLDDALSGTLDGDNYTVDEQRAMLAPVWEQVSESDERYADYPANNDDEADIMLYVNEFDPDYIDIDASTTYQYIVTDLPTIDGVEVSSMTLTSEQIGFVPITGADIIDLINEEWAEEIANGEIPTPTSIKNTEWYGIGVIMYDEYGNITTIPDQAAYMVMDEKLVYIEQDISLSKIIPLTYDFNYE